ncbi:MAG: alpha amylase N-terminal ig-like domain-containing protein [Eubacteriales bacterium]|nr:alpha amylase N-terminal ig-like domain-containing protein [Eubacteriales bacterium]
MAIDIAAVYHRSGLEFRYFQDSKLHIRLVARQGDLDSVTLLYDNKYEMGPREGFKALPMQLVASDGIRSWYEAAFLPDDPRVRYVFELKQRDDVLYLYETGPKRQLLDDLSASFSFPSILGCHEHLIPDWARGAVVYQIFVDRFHRVGELTDGLSPWGTPPKAHGMFCGGNLKGIREKADYLQELGVDVVYLTPIFQADTNHRYDTVDYMKIDPMVGTLDDLRDLSDALHARGMRLMLDGVFNHSSTRFAPFADLMQKGRDSAYKGWFLYQSLPLDPIRKNYDSFSHGAMMPKLNMADADARAYFCEVGRYWIREGHIDGWRLDVANEIDYDFLRMFRREVRAEKDDALIIGESWVDSFEWLQGDMFDGVMHYPMTFALRDFFAADAQMSVTELDQAIQRTHMLYTYGVQQASWVMLDSHDTSRLITICGGDADKMKAAAYLQFMVPGAPFVYYGDEVCLEGGDDPDCRRCMPWERTQNSDMLAYYQKLCQIKRLPALRRGDLKVLGADDGVYTFLLKHPAGSALCVINLSGRARTLAPEWMAQHGFDPEQERLWGIDWQKEWALDIWQGAVFTETQRELPPEKVLRAADFRQPFPEKYAKMMQEYIRRMKEGKL